MVETITLSIPAVDVLAEQLNLNIRQYPFEIPRIGESLEERNRIAAQVWGELEAAGLAGSGRPEAEVEDALYLLSSSEVSIAAAGLLDVRTGHRLTARVVATGEVGLVGMIDGRGLRMVFMAPDDLSGTCAELIPEAPPGPGETVRASAEREPAGQRPPEFEGLHLAEAITGRPKFRIGHYVVTNTDRRGRRGRVPGLTWFDTDRGRYTLIGEQGVDGQDVITCTPADRAVVADQIDGLLDRARHG